MIILSIQNHPIKNQLQQIRKVQKIKMKRKMIIIKKMLSTKK